MHAYEKAVLQSYRQTEAFIKSTEKAITKGAFQSFYSTRPTKDLAEEILDMKFKLSQLKSLKDATDTALSKIKPCYAYILGVKYGAGSLGVGKQLEKTKGFYRKVAYALTKFAQEMKKLGYDDEEYEEFAKENQYFKNTYENCVNFERAVKACGNLRVKDGRKLIPQK